MKVKVYYCVFGNFCSHKVYEINSDDFKELRRFVYTDIKNETWDFPLKETDVKITKAIILKSLQ